MRSQIPTLRPGQNIYWKSAQTLIKEGFLRHAPREMLGTTMMMWSMYDRNGNWCSSSVHVQPTLGKPIRIVPDSENPFSYVFTKLFRPGKVNVSEWTYKTHPEWFEVR
jgi:hypothetical protein